MANDELKPCPFCGGKARHKLVQTYSLDSSYYVIGCTDCDAMMYAGDELSDEDIADWNRRSPAPTAEEQKP